MKIESYKPLLMCRNMSQCLDTSSRVTLQNHGAAKTTLTWSNKTNKIKKKRAFNSKRTFNRQDQCYYQKEANMHNSKAKKKNLACWMCGVPKLMTGLIVRMYQPLL